MCKVSIALCTYNGADFLDEQLASFLKQTRLPDELTVSDDCSEDETLTKLKRFADVAPFPVRIYENESNLRSTKNFEKAIKLCAGDIIFLSDQDDYWQPRKIERMLREFQRDKEIGLVFSNAEIVGEKMQPLGRTLWDFTFSAEKRAEASNENLFNVLMSQNAVTGATMAFRSEYREIFMPIPNDIPNLIHDSWISLSIAALAKSAFIDENLIKYRQHSAQQLGINFEHSKAQEYLQKCNKYAASIEFCEGEIARLQRLRELFPHFKQFE
ncbi:MAG: glycosyltransferase family 2 protein, partial [Pyrinomonadaceae bacterium]|nr:glycosyltransferase family 2 protein [Pyrinomonadaceae bacterium]